MVELSNDYAEFALLRNDDMNSVKLFALSRAVVEMLNFQCMTWEYVLAIFSIYFNGSCKHVGDLSLPRCSVMCQDVVKAKGNEG